MCISLLCSIRRTIVICSFPKKIMASRQSSDMTKFREALKSAQDVVILSGAGISAESGIPTFRGAGGYWRKYQSSNLATPGAFRTSPSLVWEFYHYRREVAAKAQPNAGHIAIAQYEAKYGADKKVTVITQNVDGIHVRAGTKNLIELHGNLYKTRCTKCKEVLVNNDSPICEVIDEDYLCQECVSLLILELNNRNEGNIGERQFGHDSVCVCCGISIARRTGRRSRPLNYGDAEWIYSANIISPLEALAGRGAPEENVSGSDIPVKSLPHCKKSDCGGLLRPHIVWFGENLDPAVLEKAQAAMHTCDICLVVGTSSVVYPAAMFAPQAAERGAIVAEFNIEPTPATADFHYYFEGPCGTSLPVALAD